MKIDGRTTLHGIMGLPVSHSLSPAMHNAAFEALGLNCVYVPFAVEDVAAGHGWFPGSQGPGRQCHHSP